MSDPPRPDSAPQPPADRPAVPALRASDAEREETVNRLREAAGEGRLDVEELDDRVTQAYALKTRAELEALTADVVVTPARAAAARAAATPGGVVVRPGDGGTGTVVSIMGGHDRSGHWRIAPRCNVLNVMGGTDLDLTQVELSHQQTTITVVSIMGGGELRMPDGVDVQVSKLAIMGGNDVRLSDAPAPPGAPVIRIRLLSIMGGTSVRQGRKRSRAEKRRERELRQAERRGELGE